MQVVTVQCKLLLLNPPVTKLCCIFISPCHNLVSISVFHTRPKLLLLLVHPQFSISLFLVLLFNHIGVANLSKLKTAWYPL